MNTQQYEYSVLTHTEGMYIPILCSTTYVIKDTLRKAKSQCGKVYGKKGDTLRIKFLRTFSQC